LEDSGGIQEIRYRYAMTNTAAVLSIFSPLMWGVAGINMIQRWEWNSLFFDLNDGSILSSDFNKAKDKKN